MRNAMNLLNVFCGCLCVVTTGLLFSSSEIKSVEISFPQFVLSNNLNFSIQLDEENELKSGPEGNLYMWDRSFINSEKLKKSERCDINKIHEVLLQNSNMKKRGNKATASFTIIVKREKAYLCYL